MGIVIGVVSLKNSILEEIMMKDFTINTFVYDLIKEKMVNHSKMFEALRDLNNKILRPVVSSEETFKQSSSRIFRLLRFRV